MVQVLFQGMYSINFGDIGRGVLVALFGGAIVAIISTVSSVGFDVFTADWVAIGKLAINGAFGGFVGYITKNFFTGNSGKFGSN